MEQVIHIISGLLIILGVFFMFTGSVGILRMPDFFTRLHPAGVTDAMGMPLVLIGLMLLSGWTLTTLKLFFLLVFLLFASPTACHALAKAAMMRGKHSMAQEQPHDE